MSTTPPLKNPSPKQRFQQSPALVISRHRDLVSSPQFDHSTDAALLEMIGRMVTVPDGNQYAAIAGFHRIQGAYELIGMMKLLAETETVPFTPAVAQLDHTV